MYLRKLILCCVILTFSLLLISCSAPMPSIWTSNDGKDDSIKEDQLYTVKKGTISLETSGIGMLVASKETNLYFNQVNGVLKSIHVKVNDKVSKGDLLAEIESIDLNDQLLQADLELQKAQLKLQQTDLDIENSKKDIELAKLDLTYYSSLLSKEDNDDNREMYRRSQLKLEQYENSLSKSTKDKEIAQLDINSIEISKKSTEQKLNNCKLISHLEGIVTFVENFSVGDYIEDNKTIGTLIEPKNMVLQFVSGNLNEFASGMNIFVKISGTEYPAVVYSPMPGDLIKDPDSNIKVKNQVYLKPDKPINNMSLNEKAAATIYTKPKTDSIIIPRSALRSYDSKYWVERFTDGKVEEVEVTKGIESGATVEILKGLNEGDTILKGY